MSDGGAGNDDALEPIEPFGPLTVDVEIEERLAGHGGNGSAALADRDTRLVGALAAVYALPPEADAVLTRVRARVRAAPVSAEHGALAEDGVVPVWEGPAPVRPIQRPERRSVGVRALAGVLAAAVVVAGFVAILRLHGAPASSSPTWQNVSITAQRTGGAPLDFDPAQGVRYAVADTVGTIYACGQNHLWYSQDGGNTYAPFPLKLSEAEAQTLPAIGVQAHGTGTAAIPASALCQIATVPGAPGVFIDLAPSATSGNGTSTAVAAYAAPGSSKWQVLEVPPLVSSSVPGSQDQVAMAADAVWPAIAGDGYGWQVRAVGNWLFALVPSGSARLKPPHLFGTPDFGGTWFLLDEQVENQGVTCGNFAVDPADPQHIFCGADLSRNINKQTLQAQVWETRDEGKSWQLTSLSGDGSTTAYAVIGASTDAVYVSKTCPSCQGGGSAILRRTMAGGGWRTAAAPASGAALPSVIGVTPDDAMYLDNSGNTSQGFQVQVLARGAGAAGQYGQLGQTAYLHEGSLQQPVLGAFQLAGLGAAGHPALYLRVGTHVTQMDTFPPAEHLYRLALPPGAAVLTDTTPLPTPAATATATVVPQCGLVHPDPAAIQAGGLGAPVGTLAARWGQARGVAGGTTYFGNSPGSGEYSVGVPSIDLSGHVAQLIYDVGTAQSMTLAQAEALVATILPKDAIQQGEPAHDAAHGTVSFEYCSAAFASVFPAGNQELGGRASSGLIQVQYALAPSATDPLSPDAPVQFINCSASETQ